MGYKVESKLPPHFCIWSRVTYWNKIAGNFACSISFTQFSNVLYSILPTTCPYAKVTYLLIHCTYLQKLPKICSSDVRRYDSAVFAAFSRRGCITWKEKVLLTILLTKMTCIQIKIDECQISKWQWKYDTQHIRI